MNWYTISLPLIIVSVLLYHIAQKSIPREANSLAILAAAYFTAFIICLGALFAGGGARKVVEALKGENLLPVVLLGLAAIGIELGFLHAYRTGWKLSTTAITTSAFSSTALALIGVLWYKDQLSMLNVAGIVLCIAGVVCINMK